MNDLGPVLGVDPGTRKCGVAVVEAPQRPPLALEIVPADEFAERISVLAASHGIRVVALGGGTHTAAVAALLGELGLPFALVDERDTTLLARARYLAVCFRFRKRT